MLHKWISWFTRLTKRNLLSFDNENDVIICSSSITRSTFSSLSSISIAVYLHMLMILFPSSVMAMSDILRALCPFQHSNSFPSKSHRQMLLSVMPAKIPLLSGNHPQETNPTPSFSYTWIHSPELTSQSLITSSCPQVRIWQSFGLHETVNTGFW
uniref:Uncharacterized protein n=1 Tax=Rhizophora mucronata TaxID=61149 RepID=A0A2P2MMZ0_RHIMU